MAKECQKQNVSRTTKSSDWQQLENQKVNKLIHLHHLTLQKDLLALNQCKRLTNYSLDQFDLKKYSASKDVFTEVKQYCDLMDENYRECTNIILQGGVGTAKTFFAVSILKEANRKEYTTRYMTAATCYLGWDYDCIQDFMDSDFLVIDEIYSSLESSLDAREISVLHYIIEQRYLSMKPTICATTLDMDAFQSKVGETAMHKLTENSLVLHLNG